MYIPFLSFLYSVSFYLPDDLGGGIRSGDKQRALCEPPTDPQDTDELVTVAKDTSELCEGDAVPLRALLPLQLAGLALLASNDAARAGDGDLVKPENHLIVH